MSGGGSSGHSGHSFYNAGWLAYLMADLGLAFAAAQVAPDDWRRRVAAAVLMVAAGGVGAAAYHRPRFRLPLSLLATAAVICAGAAALVPNGHAEGPSRDSPDVCVPPKGGPLLSVWPTGAVKDGSRVDISGDGYPPNTVVSLSVAGWFKDQERAASVEDIGSVKTDSCGKFDRTWDVPAALSVRLAGMGVSTPEVTSSSRATATSGRPCCDASVVLNIVPSR